MKRIVFLVVFVLVVVGCARTQEEVSYYESENLRIERVSEHVYRHISYLDAGEFGKVSCNGMIVIDGKEALIFDTPANDAISRTLIDWVQDTLKRKIIAIVPTHFHEDCLGGLEEFHNAQVPSYAHPKTIELARNHLVAIPQNEINDHFEIKVGHKKVHLDYFGEGHTSDNIVGYFPSDKVLFGGCLVKELDANEGNLEDANPAEWANTIRKVQDKYADIDIVIPGHGKPGGKELLDYTITLFEK